MRISFQTRIIMVRGQWRRVREYRLGIISNFRWRRYELCLVRRGMSLEPIVIMLSVVSLIWVGLLRGGGCIQNPRR